MHDHEDARVMIKNALFKSKQAIRMRLFICVLFLQNAKSAKKSLRCEVIMLLYLECSSVPIES